MAIEQTIEVPLNRRLVIEVPPEVPAGKVILTFTPAGVRETLKSAQEIWTYTHTHKEEIKAELQKLSGSFGKNTFGGLDGLSYQHKVREEWDN
jgi:hypothetical protein